MVAVVVVMKMMMMVTVKVVKGTWRSRSHEMQDIFYFLLSISRQRYGGRISFGVYFGYLTRAFTFLPAHLQTLEVIRS